jgi:hypothetical protein
MGCAQGVRRYTRDTAHKERCYMMDIGLDKVMIGLIIAFFWWQTRSSQRP